MDFKKLVLTCVTSALVLSATCASAATITTYNDLVKVLAEGKNAYAVFDFTKCQVAPGDTAPTTDLNPRSVNVVDMVINDSINYAGKKMKVLAVDEHGIYGNQSFTLYRSLYRFMEDSSVEVMDDSVDPTTYKLMDRFWMVCHMSKDGSGGVAITVKNK